MRGKTQLNSTLVLILITILPFLLFFLILLYASRHIGIAEKYARSIYTGMCVVFTLCWLSVCLWNSVTRDLRSLYYLLAVNFIHIVVVVLPFIPFVYNWQGLYIVAMLHPLSIVLVANKGFGGILTKSLYCCLSLVYSMTHTVIIYGAFYHVNK